MWDFDATGGSDLGKRFTVEASNLLSFPGSDKTCVVDVKPWGVHGKVMMLPALAENRVALFKYYESE